MDPLQRLILFGGLFAIFFAVIYIRESRRRDRDWEQRWLSRTRADQERIAAAAGRGEPMADRDEAELAAGWARDQRRWDAYSGHGSWLRTAVALVLFGAALTRGSAALTAVTGGLVILALWWAARDRDRERRLARAEELNRR